MKKFILLVLSFGILFSCGEQENKEDNGYSTDLIDMDNPPVIKVAKDTFDFGTIIEGDEVTHKFEFTNEGEGALLIHSVGTECGCTVAKNWSKTPIKNGEQGFIEVSFNSQGWVGEITKRFTIVANTNPTDTKLILKGTVVGPTK